MVDERSRELLRLLPSVDRIMKEMSSENLNFGIPKSLLTFCVRSSIDHFRSMILENDNSLKCVPDITEIIRDVGFRISNAIVPELRHVINGTGVIVHTNLGRSPLSEGVVNNLISISSYYSNLEFDLVRGIRGDRSSVVEPILCEITGAEAAFVVNNNAGAVLICLNSIANSKEVVISRGELVEIGGSFRIPDIMLKSGSIIREVGTTNRTHIHDYVEAITEDTGLIMKVHTSNYGIVGFTASVSLSKLVRLGKAKSLPVMEDLGSGTFIDFSKYGFVKEPTVQESLASGIDIITFSGDKLLGGPQAGIILGKKDYIECIKRNPLARVLRIDKMTLAALEATLKLYRDEKNAINEIPILRMLFQEVSDIERRARDLADRIKVLAEKYSRRIHTKIFDMSSRVGGGALPLIAFPSKCLGVRIKGLSVNELEQIMRNNVVPIIGRIEKNYYILDLRTIFRLEISIIERAFKNLLSELYV